MIEIIRSQPLAIPFRQSFRHASATRAATQAIWVTVSGGGIAGHGEGCPREYVTGESVASAQQFITAHAETWRKAIRDVDDLRRWVHVHEREIDANPAAWTAVELAILDFFAKVRGSAVESLLGLPPLSGKFFYTAVLGDAPASEFEAQLARYCEAGFRGFKIKLAGDAERDLAKVQHLQAAGIAPVSVRGDANNLWRDANIATAAVESLRYPFLALEEPLRPGDYAGMAHMAQALGTKIILDESMTRPSQLKNLSGPPQRWLANVRVSKMGGFLRSLHFLRAARECGVNVIVGAHVGETSMLTRAGMATAAAAGDALVAQEGAFGTHLLERDVVTPPLMFGPRGMLDADALTLGALPGWGLANPDIA
jgi:L-alanine-DL-glutamate epimerase-like enolase superfamily enzyme